MTLKFTRTPILEVPLEKNSFFVKSIVLISTTFLYALLGSIFLSVLFKIPSTVFFILFGFLIYLHILFSLYLITRHGLYVYPKPISFGGEHFEIPPRFVICDAKSNKIATILSLAAELFLGSYLLYSAFF
ncbi:hypothetical protein HYX16_00680 [Candidatus Woesearchaeota archaeon]|nr:hypothetical protein [Candidatus Woesearchaeota archaeon]